MHRKKKIPVSFILAFIVSFLLAVSLAVMVPKFVPLTKQFQGMIFFGGHFSKKKREDAKSKAWISLLEDCMGIGELGKHHTLTEHLTYFGPKLDFNCKNTEELRIKLKEYHLR